MLDKRKSVEVRCVFLGEHVGYKNGYASSREAVWAESDGGIALPMAVAIVTGNK